MYIILENIVWICKDIYFHTGVDVCDGNVAYEDSCTLSKFASIQVVRWEESTADWLHRFYVVDSYHHVVDCETLCRGEVQKPNVIQIDRHWSFSIVTVIGSTQGNSLRNGLSSRVGDWKTWIGFQYFAALFFNQEPAVRNFTLTSRAWLPTIVVAANLITPSRRSIRRYLTKT